jgi:hypothetical protein
LNFHIEIHGSIAALLAAAIYHGTTGSGISYTQRNIDYICRYYRSIATAQADYVPRFIFVPSIPTTGKKFSEVMIRFEKKTHSKNKDKPRNIISLGSSNTPIVPAYGAGTAYPSVAPEFILDF